MTVTRRRSRTTRCNQQQINTCGRPPGKTTITRALSTYNTEENTYKNKNILKGNRERNTLRTPIDQWDKNRDSRSTT
jgi:hypothetical protein